MIPTLLRAIGRSIQDLAQLRSDWAWHARFAGADFPPRLHRAIEQAKLLRTSAIDAQDYYRYGLYRRDMPFHEKSAFLGKYRSYRYYRRINPLQYELFNRDKVLMHLLAAPLGVPMVPVLASTGRTGDPYMAEFLADAHALRTFLLRPGSQHLFLKPVDGTLGEGALALGERLGDGRSWRRVPGSGSIDVDEVVAHTLDRNGQMRRFLVQPRVAPHPDLARIVPDVLHTLRVGTLVHGGRVHLIGAGLRMGSGSVPVDDFTIPGGLSIPLDPLTGALGAGIEMVGELQRMCTQHPVSRVPFAGTVLPFWREALAAGEDGARKFSFLPLLSWDVGIAAHGPIITEFNTRSRWTSVQTAIGKGLLSGQLGEAMIAHRGLAASGLRYTPQIVHGIRCTAAVQTRGSRTE